MSTYRLMKAAALSVTSVGTRHALHVGKRALTESGQQAVTKYGVLIMADEAQGSGEVQLRVY